MTDEATPGQAFAGLKGSPRKRAPLSFADLSATLAAAQQATGFVDTLAAEAVVEPRNDVSSSHAPDASAANDGLCADTSAGPLHSAEVTAPTAMAAAGGAAAPTALSAPAQTPQRKGRVRADSVQCNLKISEELRDALHLQALRERRTIAEMVSEVMTAYLSAKGTFERLR
jgi:hypothetical protein